MALVKLALSGLDGVEESKVKLGSAWVVYDPEMVKAEQIAETVSKESGFPAKVASDSPYAPKDGKSR